MSDSDKIRTLDRILNRRLNEGAKVEENLRRRAKEIRRAEPEMAAWLTRQADVLGIPEEYRKPERDPLLIEIVESLEDEWRGECEACCREVGWPLDDWHKFLSVARQRLLLYAGRWAPPEGVEIPGGNPCE